MSDKYKTYEELKEENYKLREENTHLNMLNCDLEMYLKEHKSKINKAIKYIKENAFSVFDKEDGLYKDMVFKESLLEILGDEE